MAIAGVSDPLGWLLDAAGALALGHVTSVACRERYVQLRSVIQLTEPELRGCSASGVTLLRLSSRTTPLA